MCIYVEYEKFTNSSSYKRRPPDCNLDITISHSEYPSLALISTRRLANPGDAPLVNIRVITMRMSLQAMCGLARGIDGAGFRRQRAASCSEQTFTASLS